MQRLKNFLASISVLTFVYVFYTNVPYFEDYFTVTHDFDFFGWGGEFTTFQVFRIIVGMYALGLLGLYMFEKKSSTSKSIYALRALRKIITHPIKTFEKGLLPKEKVSILTLIVKVFFTPLMISWLAAHTANMFSNFTFVIENKNLLWENFLGIFQSHLFWLMFQLILFADVFFFTIGYLIEFDFLKNQIISVEPTMGGWVVALICYPPFNGIVGDVIPWASTDFPYFENPFFYVGLNILLLVLMGIYAWASVALNFKASNLTHRGIIAKGPYAYIRHPAYICKNIAWWIGALPALILGFQTGVFSVFLVILAMLMWNGIYFLRAMTEERHLRMVNEEYNQYMEKVPYRFIPGIV